MAAATQFPLTWDLKSLLPHPESEEFRAVWDGFQRDLRALADRSEELPPVDADANHVSQWIEFLERYATVEIQAWDLHSFVGCHAAADAENPLFQQWEGRLSSLDPLREKIATNLQFAFQQAGDAEFAAFVQADGKLADIAYYLEQSRKNAALRLPKEQELLAAELAVDGIHAWGRLYDRISSELRVPVMQRGEVVEKSPGQVQFDSPQRAVRENNFYAADKAWDSVAATAADALNHIAGTRLTRYRSRGLQDYLEAPLRHNRMNRQTLDVMWSSIQQRKPVLVKYLTKKAELLGLEQLAWYDLQAPWPGSQSASGSSELPYDEACELVIETFGKFSPPFGEFAQQALENKWVEVENRSGKRQGGFCTGFPSKKHSRIFMTYTNSPDSMSTLAHELGHAYHSHVLRDQPFFLQDYPMNLAETASTFAEAVLGEQRLRKSNSVAEQLSILDGMLSDAVAFLMNIHARFVFEDKFHLERADGELTPARLCELMLAAQKETYLNALTDDGWNPNFWISKLHFYISTYPFYNFPYTFGYLLSLGVYAMADEFGEDFPEQYRRLLIATGCQEAEAAVQSTFDYDLSEPTFWNKSLDIVENRVERLLQLLAN